MLNTVVYTSIVVLLTETLREAPFRFLEVRSVRFPPAKKRMYKTESLLLLAPKT